MSTPAHGQPPPKFRRKVESFEIGDPIGNPQESRVFLGRDIETDQPVAIKALPLDFFQSDREFQQFKARTAKAAEVLKHKHLLMPRKCVGKFSEAFLIMEYIPGPNLRELVNSPRPPDLADVHRIAVQLMSAVQFLHSKDLLHRNIKASNVLVRPTGDAVLSDMFYSPLFVRWRKEKGFPSVESVRYVSPEECQEKKLVPQSDIYSLGCVLFLAYTRVYPIRGQSAVELQQKHVKMQIREKPDIINPSLPTFVSDMLLKMLAKSPRKRYKDLGEVILDLRRIENKTSVSGVQRRI